MNKNTKILVTGAAGYLGRGMCLKLKAMGYEPIGLDNYSNSREIPNAGYEIRTVDIADWEALWSTCKDLSNTASIIHFAAKASVGESCEKPNIYYRNNLLCTINAARLCDEIGIQNFIHSSSCTIYGVPATIPITEQSPANPISPYGDTKRASEEILRQTAKYRPLKVMNLRYFNPAGSLGNGEWGENHDPETHLVPNVTKAAIAGTEVSILGNDYDTPDGTCIRDFIHVEDLLDAHFATLTYLERARSPFWQGMNVGTGSGYSVKEVVRATERVFGKKIAVKICPRRPGDPPKLVADIRLIQETLGWRAKRSLDEIVQSDLAWRKRS